jgi:hypothetical protein
MACEYLVGTWKSSKELSMEYNLAQEKITPTQMSFLNQRLGHMTISYTDTETQEHQLPSIEVILNGKTSLMAFEGLSYTYETITCTETIVKAKYNHPYGGETVSVLHLQGDTYWVSPDIFPTSREYFIRLQ